MTAPAVTSVEKTPVARDAAKQLDNLLMHDPATPRWIKDLMMFLPVRSQFVLSGNVRDLVPFPPARSASGAPVIYETLSLVEYLARVLRLGGVRHVLALDPIDGLRLVSSDESDVMHLTRLLKLDFDDRGYMSRPIGELLQIVQRIVTQTGENPRHVAVVIDFSSRIANRADQLQPDEHEFFRRALKLAHVSMEYSVPLSDGRRLEAFCPVIWVCDERENLPMFMLEDSPRIRHVPVGTPTPDQRRRVAEWLVRGISGYEENDASLSQRAIDTFVLRTEGMTISDMRSIQRLAEARNIDVRDLEEAIVSYRTGVTEDRWRLIESSRVSGADEEIRKHVMGQPKAVRKAVEIIKRAKAGLSGAHAASSARRPRGVLFFAGPTGTGKTEMAKAITRLLFNDESAYIRFDMSEFSAEHSDARLLGAPPGFVGYESGGELVNAIRERPFSVVLFDEIEKAHPRILDKFLQLLDEGQITSGRGERVYFSEAIIVFTSNLGMYRYEWRGETRTRVERFDYEKPPEYEQVEREIMSGVRDHFEREIGRPELLNRIGENVVVFDFIRVETAEKIFTKMLGNVVDRLLADREIALMVVPDALARLREACIGSLRYGGRGIGNKIEALFTGPLAAALVDGNVQDGAAVAVTSWSSTELGPELAISVSAGS